MTPPSLTCPSPQPDCGLYSHRAYDSAEMLRRALLRERHHYVGLRQLVRAEAALQADLPPAAPPPPPPTLPALPAPVPTAVPPIPIKSHEKGLP